MPLMPLTFVKTLHHACWVAVCVLGVCGMALAQPSAAPPAATQAARLAAAVQHFEAGRYPQAQAAFEQLARQGLPAAHYNLAVMHLQGHVPQTAGQPAAKLQQAERLLTRAAQRGFVTAQFMLAQALESGQLGRRDLVLAHRWYEVAALAGSVPAQVAMGTAYYLGRGRAKNPQQALQWFREGAKGGDIGAMYLLASMYEQGDGTDVDLRLARYWYGIAADQGDEAAPSKVKELDARAALLPS
jgi:uncharacterized protein